MSVSTAYLAPAVDNLTPNQVAALEAILVHLPRSDEEMRCLIVDNFDLLIHVCASH